MDEINKEIGLAGVLERLGHAHADKKQSPSSGEENEEKEQGVKQIEMI